MFYLFPFGRIKPGSSIAIYGCGDIGQSYLEQLSLTNYCNVIFVTDQQIISERFLESNLFIPTSRIAHYDFDNIVVASRKYKDEIYEILISIGLSVDKIIPFEPLEIKFQYNRAKSPVSFDWSNYYNNAEAAAQTQFDTYIKPILVKYASQISFCRVLDFACGKGRIAEIFRKFSQLVICTDINEDSINHCRTRFANCKNVSCIVNEHSMIPLESDSVSFVYSWDAMVHFKYKDMDYFLGEFHRVMNEGAFAFIHHSNLASLIDFDASEDWINNPHFRSNINIKDVNRLAIRHGFEVIDQIEVDWDVKGLDGITVLRKN